MTMTKAQQAKKRTEERAKRSRTILLYALTLLCSLSMWTSYKLAEDVALNEAAIVVRLEKQLEMLDEVFQSELQKSAPSDPETA